MDSCRRAVRVGATALMCAAAFRLSVMGVPETVTSFLNQPNIAAFLLYLETGRDVRFSSSETVFSPDFMESPPPALPAEPEPEIPGPSDWTLPEIRNTAGKAADAEALLVKPLEWELRSVEPTVLILHTHTTESYTKQGEPYTETSSWRTLDEEYNMLSIGDLVAECLEQQGIGVLQDRELHDYPSYNGSYVHARKSIAAYLEEYPSLRLVLDLHRDASGGDSGQMRTVAQTAGEAAAQLMIVLGTNHGNYEDNLSLALKLHAQLEAMNPGIMRPLQLRAQRFNQDLSPGALLIEVGAAGNSHTEARRAAQALAEGIIALAGGAGDS